MTQDPREISQLVKSLEAAKSGRQGKSKHGFSCKKNTYSVAGTNGIKVDSWKFNDWDYSKDNLPTYARGLFTTHRFDGSPEIVIRGYDKFFNVNELRKTEWPNIEKGTVGPYELSVKENGCIIFLSGLEDGTLLVCSKHSTGAREDADKSHAVTGEKWVDRHLADVGKSKFELAQTLRQMNVTAVAELCDDAFEEHVLAYPPEMAGLYLHGVNFNQPEFATLSGPEVHEFADTWGFKKAQYTMIQTIEETKAFLEACAETGSWEGRDTEGFVVRCKIRGSSGQHVQDWFFKYKFDEPYLMYRQWRECTKAVIAGKPPKIRKHKKITEEYLLYARRQLAKDPRLGKQYNQNHGIIRMRDGFLQEKGVRGSDIIANEEEEERDGQEPMRDIVLVPIATIGCGKTTVATALTKLFDFGHIQNDNIQGSKNRASRFVLQITANMVQHSAVIADRNNHQFRERQQLIDDILRVVPNARFVALHYVHDPKDRMVPEIRKVTARRVLDRGDNHQTIHAGTKGEAEILGIMDGFLHRFQPLDTSRDPDAHFDQVVNLDVAASPEEQLETVITCLYNAYPKLFSGDMPTHQDMADAVSFAQGAQVTVQHSLSFGKDEKQKQTRHNVAKKSETPVPLKDLSHEDLSRRLEYFGATVSSTVITSTLSSLFQHASEQQSRFYKQLKQSDRIQKDFHVTLIHRTKAASHAEIWNEYTSTLVQKLAEPSKNAQSATPSLGPARVRLERLVWDDRVMCVLVRLLPSDNGFGWQCANDYPHITIGTANAQIKPKESNDLLVRWMESADNDGNHLEGHIWDLEVPGVKVLEAAVRPVMQRGK